MKFQEKSKAILRLAPVGALFLFLCVAAWLHKPQETSLSERRALAQRPRLTADSVLGGQFMTQFDRYSMDQFPGREGFRRLKSLVQYRLMGQRDINGIFLARGSAVKLEDPVNPRSIQAAGAKLEGVLEQYLPSGRAFYAWVPDKGYFFRESGYPLPDYALLEGKIDRAMAFAQKIDLTGALALEDYYATDSHWRQERLEPAARQIAQAMGVELEDLSPALAREDFSGVYAGQTALPLEAEAMYFMTAPALEDCTLYNEETGRTTGLYDLERLWGRDPYDLYLGGAAALQVIENPSGPEGRELVIFRDSFGSSLAPWLASGYRRITLVDLRYLSSSLLGDYLEDRGQDVLFLYSTGIWNNSALLK